MKKVLLQVLHLARKGYFEVADGGTIFLDEVGELPSNHSGKIIARLRKWRIYKSGIFPSSKNQCKNCSGYEP